MRGKKILVRSVNWLGDAVMSTAALGRLREANPGSEICLLTPAKLIDLWHNHPAVDRAIAFSPQESIWKIAATLRTERFDIALVLPNSFRSALEPWLAGIPERIGYAGNWRAQLLTKAIHRPSQEAAMRKRTDAEIKALVAANSSRKTYSPASHHIEHYLRLAAELGGGPYPLAPSIPIGRDEIKAFREKFRIEAAQPVLSLNPGAEYGSAKRWPADSFIAAARKVQAHFNGTWLLLGGPNDMDVCEKIARALREGGKSNEVLNLAGKTTLRELGAALAASKLLLTNDTGPMHLGAAVGTRVVAIFGSTSPELTGPGLPNQSGHLLLSANVACAPCFRRVCPIDFRCMHGINPETVADAVLRSLSCGI